MRLRVLVLAAALLAAGACGHATHPGAVVWGTLDATVYSTAPSADGYVLEPRAGGPRDPEIEAQLTRSLDWRGIAVGPDQSLLLRYMMHSVPVDAEAEGLGILLGGSVGSSGTGNDVGLGLDLPLLMGDRKVRHTAFSLELSVEDAAGTLYWRGRAEGRSRSAATAEILRPVVPSLIDRIGADVRGKRFAR